MSLSPLPKDRVSGQEGGGEGVYEGGVKGLSQGGGGGGIIVPTEEAPSGEASERVSEPRETEPRREAVGK